MSHAVSAEARTALPVPAGMPPAMFHAIVDALAHALIADLEADLAFVRSMPTAEDLFVMWRAHPRRCTLLTCQRV